MEWRQDDWLDAADTIQQLRDMGFQILKAQHPFIHEGSLRYKALKDSGFLNKTPEGHAGTFDHSNPQARQAWWELTKRFYQDGIRGYWTEMGELEKHPEGTESHLGPREKVHNTYAMLWAKGLYDGQTQDFNEQVMILSRTAYAGMLRYGTALWSGDINSEWEVLRKQIVFPANSLDDLHKALFIEKNTDLPWYEDEHGKKQPTFSSGKRTGFLEGSPSPKYVACGKLYREY